jgi:hypothetical protein
MLELEFGELSMYGNFQFQATLLTSKSYWSDDPFGNFGSITGF